MRLRDPLKDASRGARQISYRDEDHLLLLHDVKPRVVEASTCGSARSVASTWTMPFISL